MCIYIHTYIRRPLPELERASLQLQCAIYNPQYLPIMTNIQASKPQVARQLKSTNPTLRAPRQLESRIWVPECLNQKILSSYFLL